ncbi:tannase and feruloyl esterase [Curvularia clavata]|uniref:Carboxylic ester hydrolase n=1 Tax=Curvularia clavata TaxID=95742 RepID=A0A9Q8ZB27_CURCL|nr:tannase and feruloyl esterase [Curvularia clavata]
MKFDSIISSATFAAAANTACNPAAIQALLPTGADLNFARVVAANETFEVPKGDTGYPNSPPNLPALCAISVQVQSIQNSTYGFGLFLPENWNGRFLAVGNGGFAGGINYEDMASGVRYGFAVMSTDTGHNSTVGDGQWAYQHPERIANWGYLAMHGSVVVSKQIVAAYYAENVSYSYYSGCSTGGRQGLKEAEAFPEDFDGILAGAPAWWTTHLQPWTIRVALYNLPETADYHIPASLFAVINAEVLKQCDPQDGLVDNIISNPEGCNFRPEALLCGANSTGNSSHCLSTTQLHTLHNIYSDYVDESNTFFFPGLSKGTEGQPFLVAANAPNSLGSDYPKYFLGLGPEWRFDSYTDAIIALSDKINPGNATVKFDLSAYYKKGGKILSYHGLADPLIPYKSSPYFYNEVYRTLKPKGIDIGSFYKFFDVPGMSHCSGTTPAFNAPWYFAGANQQLQLGDSIYSTPGFENEEHDVLLALVAWVEKGRVPEQIIATKYVNDTTHDKVLRQRPLCMYPTRAEYRGHGDPNEAKNWNCKSLY